MVQLGDIVRVLLHDLLYALLVDVLQVFDLWHLGHIFINLLEAFDETWVASSRRRTMTCTASSSP